MQESDVCSRIQPQDPGSDQLPRTKNKCQFISPMNKTKSRFNRTCPRIFSAQTRECAFAGLLGPLLLLSQAALAHNTLSLGTGTLAGQNIRPDSIEITVAPSTPIYGNVSVLYHNEMSPGAVAPIAATPTWGQPSTSYWSVADWAPTGDSTHNVAVNLVAPATAGTYYVIIAAAGTYDCAQIMSGTHPGWPADWSNGNIVARLPKPNFDNAALNGWIPFNWYSPNGPVPGEMAMTVVKVIVTGGAAHNTLSLGTGTLAGQNITRANNQITVSSGSLIQGSFSVAFHNEMSPSAVAPIAAVPNWLDCSSNYWCVESWAPAGDSTHTVQVNQIAPGSPGTYYLIVASAGTYDCAQIISGTHPGWPARWDTGNSVCSLSSSTLELAAANGWIAFNWYSPNGPVSGEMAMTVVKVVVNVPRHNILSITGGTLAGQVLNPSSSPKQIVVAPGQQLTGTFNLNYTNQMDPGAVAPIAATPTWGDPASSYWTVASSAPTGGSSYTVQVNLTAPATVGTYYIAVGAAGTYDCAQIMSGTHPGWPADWVKGNIVARLPASTLESSCPQGWLPFDWYTPSGPARGEMAMAVIRVVVSPPTIKLAKSVRPVFERISIGSSYQLQVSTDGLNWSNDGSPFTATNISMAYPKEWDVENWNQMFFRLNPVQ